MQAQASSHTGTLVLVTGGARSGKSQYAEHLTQQFQQAGSRIAYIATSQSLDSEMAERIACHRAQRPASWTTFEEPLSPAALLPTLIGRFDTVLLDCLTVLLSNRILAPQVPAIDWDAPDQNVLNWLEAELLAEIDVLISVAAQAGLRLIAVSNELGCGLVPLQPLGRFFRDCAGRVNQRMAAAADAVYLVVSGIPVQIKG